MDTLSLFIFHRDLRLDDNTALIAALNESEEVIPCFIFDPVQVGNQQYRSMNAVQFMIESLQDLEAQLKGNGGKLHLFYGPTDEVVKQIISQEKINAVYSNKDYTPFSKKRDEHLRTLCEKKGVAFIQHDDALLFAPGSILKDDGKPYTIFTPFFRKMQMHEVPRPQACMKKAYSTKKVHGAQNPSLYKKILPASNRSLAVRGGRKEALKTLSDLSRYTHYDHQRDYPALDSTTHLSAHLKFGTISARELHHAVRDQLGFHHSLFRELAWRDFFTNIAHHFPHVFGSSFHKEYDKMSWEKTPANFKAWREGRTGFPIVDAGMRELNATGYMHNRVRMITASFLVKDLHIDWRLGEQYFAQHLVDYDPCVNNGNWQWAASTGCDAQPYFRIFNPWLQQQKFDPTCVYIKKWVPELKDLDVASIHSFHKQAPQKISYPQPILDHNTESKKALAAYKEIL